MDTDAQISFRLPFPPSNSFLTESFGSGSACSDDALEVEAFTLL